MRNNLKISLLIFALSIFAACEKTEIEPVSDFEIKFGSECGWCAGQEYITITSSEIKYLRNVPCGENQGNIQKERLISMDEWNKINLSFDYTLFKTLNYSECNVCADGCDEIIEITEDNNAHQLRYSPTYQVEGMKDLQIILTDLLEEMRNLD